MGDRALPTLQASWRGRALALWAWDGRRPARLPELERVARAALPMWRLSRAQLGTVGLRLPTGPVTAVTLAVPSLHAGSLLLEAVPQRSWSPSLRWCHAAAGLAARAVATGRVLPVLRSTSSLAWSVGWELVDDPDLDEAIERLASVRPPVVGAADGAAEGAAPDPLAHTRTLVGLLADGLARDGLDEEGWRPDLGSGRSAAAVAVRRVAEALSGPVTGVTSSNARQEAVFAELQRGCDDARSLVEGTVPLDVRCRLHPPGGPDEPWRVVLEVAARLDPSLVAPAAEIWTGTDLAHTVVGPGGTASARRTVRAAADRLAVRIPPLAALATDPAPAEAALDLEGAAALLGSLDRAERAGVPILVPAGLVRRRPRVTASAARPTAVEGGGPSGDLSRSLVEVDWSLVLGDEALSESELQSLAAAKAGLVQVRGQWLRVDPDEVLAALERLARRRSQPRLQTPGEVLRTALEVQDEGGDLDASGWLGELLAGLPDDRLVETVEPARFTGELRHYQRRALSWLAFLGRLGLGGCLADDMGLGKTPTTLAHLAARAGERPSLVLCPLSVVRNWEREAGRFTPSLRTLVLHGSGRRRGASLTRAVAEADLVVTTYGTATRDVEALAGIDWEVVVCDEAQAIKNHHTSAAQAVRRLPARQKVALTGTPVENRLAELWAILDAVNPGMLGGVTWFRERFATPIERDGDERALDGLRRLTRPFVLRRTKADRTLVPDLPDKVETVAWATLTREQASLYRAVLDDFLGTVDEASDAMSRRGQVLAAITRLKQICNHPAHFLADGSRLEGRSGKLARFDELVDELLEAGERALVFTQYREMGQLLVQHLATRRGLEVPFLHGGVPKARRDAMVERFQSGEGPPLQLVSLKAGGTGLNLTAASRVVHYDRWWNPAVENQATDRAWRIGQRATVFVHKLVCQGTLEERIDALITQKQQLADLAVGSGEGWLTELSTDELRDLLRLDLAVAEGRA